MRELTVWDLNMRHLRTSQDGLAEEIVYLDLLENLEILGMFGGIAHTLFTVHCSRRGTVRPRLETN